MAIAFTPAKNGPAGTTQANTRALQVLVVAVFFLFGGITNLNDVLIPKLKGLFQLNNANAALVQFAFFTSYAIFSIPAGMLMQRLGYVRGIVLGFGIMAVSCLLFLPAAYSGLYGSFLVALFMIGGGITLLQVAVNPLILSLGSPETAHSRLTFAQLFNSIGVFLMVRFGAELILGNQSAIDPATLSGDALTAHRVAETSVIGHTYIGLAIVLTLIAGFFWLWRSALDGQKVEAVKTQGMLGLLRRPRLALGCLCIFLYVGAEVSIGSFMVNYLGESRTLGLDAKSAGVLLSYYWLGALIGRFFGGFLLRWIKAGHLLAGFALAAIGLIAVSTLGVGAVAGYALVCVGLANSIMFPTIFSLATEGLREEAPQASGLLCTAIVGGAIVPFMTGALADGSSLASAMIIPAACYGVIAAYALWTARKPSPASAAA